MKAAIAQIAPVFMDRDATTKRIAARIREAAAAGAQLVAFGETLLPAYPLWLCRTDGARFEAADQKRLHALYLRCAVSLADGHLEPLQTAAAEANCAAVVGLAERDGHTIYCSRVIIDAAGAILSVHRKLMPTYEERLSWGPGDGAGLVTHEISGFTVGALNCWENWMPLARASLYAAGENLHVMLWPGCERLTRQITPFVAKEMRGYVLSASNIIRPEDLPADLPERDRMCAAGENIFYDGGSCIAGPDGKWIVEPVVGREELIFADLDLQRVFEERQNFDPVGHYARPDVLQLTVNRRRLSAAEFVE